MSGAGEGKSQITDPRFTAAVKLIERTGAKQFRVGYSDPEDGEPTVWYALATYKRPEGVPVWKLRADAAAALDPLQAVLRLCERLIDGGQCNHCGQRTIFSANSDTLGLQAMGCVYSWDPVKEEYRRGCMAGIPV